MDHIKGSGEREPRKTKYQQLVKVKPEKYSRMK